MSVKLVGQDDATAAGGEGAGYFILEKYTAVASGNMTEYRVKSSVAGNVKCAIYADSAGEPGALITAMNTGQAVAAGQWNTLTFTSTPITSGTVYWLAFNIDTNGAIDYLASGAGIERYKAASYPTFAFPDPAGSGFVSATFGELIAGWGTLPSAYKNIATRFKLTVLNYRDIATRFKLTILGYCDTVTRFILTALNYQDIATRFQLTVLNYRDIATRFKLTVLNYRDIATRFKLTVLNYRDIATRFKLGLFYRDIATRFFLVARSHINIATRFNLKIGVYYQDTYTRFQLAYPTLEEVYSLEEEILELVQPRAHFRI